jgi:hypothetical protein
MFRETEGKAWQGGADEETLMRELEIDDWRICFKAII